MHVATSETSPRGGYRDALHALRRAQKPARGTPAYSRHLNRPLARRVAAAAQVLGLTPNALTAISAGCSAAGLALLCLARPGWTVGVAVAVLLAVGYVLDSADGQLARLGSGGTVSGEWLDHTVDCVKTTVLHLAVLVSWYRFPPIESDALLVLPAAFQVVDLALFFGVVTMPLLRRRQDAGEPVAATTREHPLRTWLILPTDYGVFCWMFLLLGWPEAFVAVYAGMFAVNAAILPLALRKWWRELRALDRAEA